MSERVIEGRVAPADGEKRLIDYLCGRFSYLGRELWLSHIGEGALLVNGTRADPAQSLAAGDLLRFTAPSHEEPTVPLHYGLAYEDQDYLVADKPPLLPVHPSGIYFAHTLWSLLRREGRTVHIITRLDRETSGLVLMAKNAAAARHAQEAQKTRDMEKRYLAVTHGSFPTGALLAEGWLAPDEGSRVRKKRRFTPCEPPFNALGGRQAEAGQIGESCATSFAALCAWQADDGPRSLVEARLLTGRTHQIRATLLALGYPIVGDKLYGLDEGFFLRFIENSLSEDDHRLLALPYQALHCSFLSLKAADGRVIRVEAPPPWPPTLGVGKAQLDMASWAGHKLG